MALNRKTADWIRETGKRVMAGELPAVLRFFLPSSSPKTPPKVIETKGETKPPAPPAER